ncbi:MAG: HEAT repeat domain-containing protein, partial [Planctomycetota bacterium]|nr:HEAT repeat domain-containing protein [Planctomycetota bacterium]
MNRSGSPVCWSVAVGILLVWSARGGEAPAGPPPSKEYVELLEQALEYPHEDVQRAALRDYEHLGPRAMPAQDGLFEKLRKAPTLQRGLPYARALIRLGPGICPRVQRLMDGKELKPLMVLVKAGVEDSSRATELLRLLQKYPDPEVSLPADTELKRIGKGSAAPGYVKSGQGEDSATRAATLRNLISNKPTPEHREYLLAAVQDPNWRVRTEAAELLVKLNALTPEVAATVAKVFEDEDKDARTAAANALGKMGELGVPHLAKALEHEHSGTRLMALVNLGKIGPAAKSALPAIREAAAKTTIPRIPRSYFTRTEAKITGDTAAALDQYIEAIRPGPGPRPKGGRVPRDGDEALRELTEIGPPAAERALPILREIILAADFKTPPNPVDPVTGVIRGIPMKYSSFEGDCVAALPHFGRAAVPLLAELYGRSDTEMPRFIENALDCMGHEAEVRHEVLTGLAESGNAKARAMAAEKLRLFRPPKEVSPRAPVPARPADRKTGPKTAETAPTVGTPSQFREPLSPRTLADAESQDTAVREKAWSALWQAGNEALPAVGKLLQA